jgi:hypothetical protein
MLQENNTHTILSFFNNDDNGRSRNSEQSSGMIVALNHISCEATLIRQYLIPKTATAISQGSVQLLPNTNVFVGWGSLQHVSEHLEDGTLIFHAQLKGGIQSYRAFKFPWVGLPRDRPTLWTYARTPQSQTVFYVSWNGATEVAAWNFYVVAGANEFGPFILAGTKRKAGFETSFIISEYHQWAFAEALGADGASLRNSTVVSTWTPGLALSMLCDDSQCPESNSTPSVHLCYTPEEFHDLKQQLDDLKALQAPMAAGTWMGQLMVVVGIILGLMGAITWLWELQGRRVMKGVKI